MQTLESLLQQEQFYKDELVRLGIEIQLFNKSNDIRLNRLGYLKDPIDIRDYKFSVLAKVKNNLPSQVDLRTKFKPTILDQGMLGSCVANAVSSCYQYLEMLQKKKTIFQPSRLFIYYNERVIENTVSYDSGAYIRDGFKTINKQGVCDEQFWNYDISRFTIKPTNYCYLKGKENRAIEYKKLNNTSLTDLKGCLAEGFPFVFGFAVYDSFFSDETYDTGVANLPTQNDELLGYHAALCLGFSNATQRFLIQNSWGTDFGDNGYFTLPYSYLTNSNLVFDVWTARKIS